MASGISTINTYVRKLKLHFHHKSLSRQSAMTTAAYVEKFSPDTPRRPRKFEITLKSAEGLPDVRDWGRMKVSANHKQLIKTETDKKGKTNPIWRIGNSFEYEAEAKLVVELYCERTLGDRLVCVGEISVKELFERWQRSQDGVLDLVVELHRGEGSEPRGKLNISYSLKK